MKFHVRIIQFDILLVLNKYTSTFKNSPNFSLIQDKIFAIAGQDYDGNTSYLFVF